MTDPVPGPQATAALMQSVLDSVISTFGAAGVALPPRQYLHVGAVAYDCEQVVVAYVQSYLGPPGDQADTPQRCDAPRTAVLAIHIVRCIPQPAGRAAAPTPASLTAAAETQTADAWLLMDAAAALADDWLGILADVSVTDPQGGFQGVVLNLTIGIP